MTSALAYTIKKICRLTIIIASLFFILTCAVFVLVPRFFNTEAFKNHIESTLTAQLQRIVHIQDVSISFLPDIHIQLSGLTVSDAVGFGKVPQIEGQTAEIYLEIWPLFEKKVVIERIVIRDLRILFKRLVNGKNNWSDLINVNTPPTKATGQTTQDFTLQTNLNIAIKDARIEIDDQLNKRNFKLSHVEYQSTGFIQNIIHLAFDMTASLPINNGACYIDTHTELNGRASLLINQGRYSINDAHLQMNATGLFPGDHFVESHLDTRIALSYEHEALELSDMQLQVKDILFQGNIYARKLFKVPAISGQIFMHTKNLVDTLSFFLPQKMGFSGPLTGDILFRTRGKTLESLIKQSEIEIHTKTGSGNMVLPDHMLDKNNILLKQLTQADIHLHLSHLQNMQNKAFQYGFQTQLDGDIKGLNALLDMAFTTRSHVYFGPDLYNICINDGAFSVQANWKKLSGEPYHIKGNISGNLKTQRALIKNVSISGPLINGHFSSEIISQNNEPAIQSHVNIKIDQVRKVCKAFSLTMPKFHDPTACKHIAFDGDILLTKNYMQLSRMAFTIDEAEILGNIIYHYHPSMITFHLTANHLNLDRHWIYQSKQTRSHSGSANNKISAKDTMAVNGTIQFNDLRIYNVSIDHMQVNYSVKDKQYRFSPMIGKMYGGNFNGHLTYDYQPSVPKTSLLIHCKDIQIDQFLKDYNQFDRIIGLLNMKASLSWDLKGGRMVRSSINGNAKMALTKGIINGIQIVPTDVQKQILEIHKKQALEIPKQQYLNKIKGLVRFRNGCMHNSDLIAYAKGLRLKGKGNLDLVKNEVDYMFYVGIAHFPIIPYHVKGPIKNVKTYLDTSEFLKIAVTDFFNQAGKLGSETIKDTLELSGKAFDVNTDPLQNTVDKSSETIKKTIDKSSGTIKETLAVGTDIIHAGKDAFQTLGNRLKGFFFNQNNEKKPTHDTEKYE
jgi:uncharacterized protein involved in outer membrane biogenesis